MNPTRNGKIARLPLAIREQLNSRLQDGEQGKKLVLWFIGLEVLEHEIRKNPEAQAAFRTLFDLFRHPYDPTESE
jgi:hypothetical protein